MKSLDRISIRGFKSIRELDDFELRPKNVLIGANGSGKSNFIEVFSLLRAIVEERLQTYVATNGYADNLLYFGAKTTDEIAVEVWSEPFGYRCRLAPGEEGGLFFGEEGILTAYDGDPSPKIAFDRLYRELLDSGHRESIFQEQAMRRLKSFKKFLIDQALHVVVYHFHDTSASSKMRQPCDVDDNRFLRPDAANLAAFLYYLNQRHENVYRRIVSTIRSVAPFFQDFALEPSKLNPQKIQLEWRHKGTDAYFNAHSLSDGTLRFICLAAVLLQPDPPATILLDEPELGLHPHAIGILAELIDAASKETQVLVSTQSVTLTNQFEPEDIVVVERENEATVLKRLDREDITVWLDDYGMGDLWEKNIVGGRP